MDNVLFHFQYDDKQNFQNQPNERVKLKIFVKNFFVEKSVFYKWLWPKPGNIYEKARSLADSDSKILIFKNFMFIYQKWN